MNTSRLPDGYFERLYQTASDPWGLQDRWYERRKYALTVASLPQQRYRRVLEPGCSVGVLTAMLAARCDELIATDVVESALGVTEQRVASTPGLGKVQCRRWALGSPWARLGRFDLVVLSEVGYYLQAEALQDSLDTIVDHLDPGGHLLCVHWQHPAPDYPLTGAQVHRIAHSTAGLSPLASYRDPDFHLDVFTRGPTSSVAALDGLLDRAD
ncbi:SAM-dependent methyltransferase [Aldersonia kunmingensis]|uniref:SAM-dependent methyltransferase n=1 Tax=Aldersonia kunmingensis TaxID=408066 RepID=UPI00082AB52E|nr:SAM-dependent methyltransferase [Aldersonia kunmingensis]